MLFGMMGAGTAFAQPAQTVTFRFVAGQDMFYIPWGGNDAELNRLYSLVDEYRAEITSGRMPVYVDGYSASMRDGKRNLDLAFIRANRVKSELITHKGLVEDNFITKNYTTAYTDADGTVYKDMVVVTLRIPAREEQPDTARLERERREREAAEQAARERAEREAAEQAERDRIAAQQAAPAMRPSFCFDIRTNLLYDAFLLPTLGVEWRASRSVGVKLDIGGSYWGSEHGKVQKMWLVSPEVRWYLTPQKRFYVGAAGNIGEANIYKGMLGGLFSKDTGYQGSFWNAGLAVGYKLRLNRSLSLDFNLGLGYSRFEYDTFRVVDRVRLYRNKDLTKELWGPTQAGINLIWTIGNNK